MTRLLILVLAAALQMGAFRPARYKNRDIGSRAYLLFIYRQPA